MSGQDAAEKEKLASIFKTDGTMLSPAISEITDLLQELNHKNAIYASILDSLDEGLCFVNKDKEIVFANKEFLKIHKLKEEDIISRPVGELFPGTGHFEALETGLQGYIEEIYFEKTGAKVRPKYKPLKDSENNLIGSLALVREMSKIQEIALELRSLGSIYEKFSLVFNNLREGIVATDLAGKVVYVNSAYAGICGQEIAELVGVNVSIAGLAQIIDRTLQESNPSKEKLTAWEGLHLETVCIPLIVDDALVGCLCIIQDQTQLLKLNEKLEHTTYLAEYLKNQLYCKEPLPPSFDKIVGKSAALKEALALAAKAALTSCKILIRGDNGVGKELVAKAIHYSSDRANGPLVCVNCAAMPDTLLESELFGYDEGAFTGAKKGGKPGKFELANGGTLFLDEVGDMSAYMQAKLLRILQEMEVERVGGTKSRKLDVRVIAATNRDLERMIENGQFREDLYYRLNVVSVTIPALKDRKEDIPLLVEFLLEHYSQRYNRKLRVSEAVMRALLDYCWPGNVRELSNAIERATVLAEGGVITLSHLPLYLRKDKAAETDEPILVIGGAASLEHILLECEKQAIIKALAECDNNKTKAMKALNLSRRAFYYKAKRHGIV